MKATAIVFILAVLVALGLSGYNTWAMIELKKEAKKASDNAIVSMNVAQNARLQVGNMLDLDEFSNLDPDFKAMYKQVYVAKIMPAAIRVVNEVWAAIPEDKKEEARRMATEAGDQVVRQLNREKNEAIRQLSREMGFSGPAPVMKKVVRATMKPIMAMTKKP
jgi:hypothetical protein